MPIIEISPLLPEGKPLPDALPRQIAMAMEEGLGWPVERFTVHVTPISPESYFAKGMEGAQHTGGHCLVHVTCAGGKGEAVHRTIVELVAQAVSTALDISRENIIVMLQPMGPGCLLGGGVFL